MNRPHRVYFGMKNQYLALDRCALDSFNLGCPDILLNCIINPNKAFNNTC